MWVNLGDEHPTAMSCWIGHATGMAGANILDCRSCPALTASGTTNVGRGWGLNGKAVDCETGSQCRDIWLFVPNFV